MSSYVLTWDYGRAGGDFRGPFKYYPIRENWFGNPACSPEVEDIMKTIKHKEGQGGDERHHSLAMSKQYMDQIFEWSKQVCPELRVEELPKDLDSLKHIAEHLRYRAFSGTGFVLWTR